MVLAAPGICWALASLVGGRHMDDRKIIVLTGASRGIGHATVKRFSQEGWRVITCSRNGFPENCPWEAGPEDHLQVDLAAPQDVERGVAELKSRLNGAPLHALVNNAGISPKTADGRRLDSVSGDLALWQQVYQVNVSIRWLTINGSVKTEVVGVQKQINKALCHKKLVVTLRSASLEFN